MTIQEAINSNQPVRRKEKDKKFGKIVTGTTGLLFEIKSETSVSTFQITKEDILATDWEVENKAEEKMFITEKQLRNWLSVSLVGRGYIKHSKFIPPSVCVTNEELIEDLIQDFKSY